jgi:hypothetical protein
MISIFLLFYIINGIFHLDKALGGPVIVPGIQNQAAIHQLIQTALSSAAVNAVSIMGQPPTRIKWQSIGVNRFASEQRLESRQGCDGVNLVGFVQAKVDVAVGHYLIAIFIGLRR